MAAPVLRHACVGGLRPGSSSDSSWRRLGSTLLDISANLFAQSDQTNRFSSFLRPPERRKFMALCLSLSSTMRQKISYRNIRGPKWEFWAGQTVRPAVAECGARSALCQPNLVCYTYRGIMNTHFEELGASPAQFPIRIDRGRRIVTFVEMTREDYRRSSFLDADRVIHSGHKRTEIDLDELMKYFQHGSGNTIHYVLHSAFGCSTLLARYLESLASCFVLKEPGILTQLARLWPKNKVLDSDVTRNQEYAEWQRISSLGLKLLARTYSDDQLIFIKPNSLCNILGRLLLQRDDQSKVVFVTTELRTFLLSVLPWGVRRTWIRECLGDLQNLTSGVPFLSDVETATLSDAEAASYFWVVNRILCEDLCNRFGKNRIMVLDGEGIAEHPATALRRTTKFFGLAPGEEELAAIISNPAVRCVHSKNGEPYDATTRRKRLAAAASRTGMEVHGGVVWAANQCLKHGFDIKIGDDTNRTQSFLGLGS
jgi:hypothetical protein